MISLKDSIEIHTTPRRLFAWLERMPQEYQSWHQDHVACQVIRGSMLEVDSEIECQEYLHGKLHTMRFRMTKVVPDKRIEFVVIGMGRGAFEAQIIGDAVRFIAELDIGSDAPIIGRCFDLIMSLFFQQRIAAMRQHMIEEGQNLKAILEVNSPIG
jgi:hypothetical protein